MPTPEPNETRSHFVGRCIPYVKKEEPSIETDHAVAKCHGIWEQHKRGNRAEEQEQE